MLYDKNGKPREDEMGTENEVDVDCKGPSVSESEITSAIKEMRKTAAEIDNIPVEFWMVLGEQGMKEFTELCQEMYEKGVWPADVTRIVMIPIEKKINAMESKDPLPQFPQNYKLNISLLQNHARGE